MGEIDWRSCNHVVVLTGAGVSVASGLRPYRGEGGLWTESPELEVLSTAGEIARDPDGVWRAFGPMRRLAQAAVPNAAHAALAELERNVRVTLLTQNIDRLHHRAGSQNVLELHGALFQTRCSGCGRQREDDVPHERAPICSDCGAPERPNVVLFDEPLDPKVERSVKQALRSCDLFIAIGTSGTVAPASNYARSAKYEGARTIAINIAPMSPRNPYFDAEILGRAELLVPQLVRAAG